MMERKKVKCYDCRVWDAALVDRSSVYATAYCRRFPPVPYGIEVQRQKHVLVVRSWEQPKTGGEDGCWSGIPMEDEEQ